MIPNAASLSQLAPLVSRHPCWSLYPGRASTLRAPTDISKEAWVGHHLRTSSEAPLILHLLQRGQANHPLLRASSDHCFIVGALRARRMAACPLSSFYAARLFVVRLLGRDVDARGRLRDASACNFSPNAPITLRMVSKSGLRSPESALYRLSRERPASRAT